MRAYIINYNRVGLMRNLADWCAAHGLEPVIVDNNSDYPPLLDYYSQCPYEVVRLGRNYGSHAFWDAGVVDREKGQYIVTDPDLDLTGVPSDFLEVMKEGLRKHPRMIKCGLSLEINDLPDTEQAQEVRAWEGKYWGIPLDDMYFRADTASTFALYQSWRRRWRLLPSIRTNRPYTARHVPWYYTNFDSLPEDERYYYQYTNPRWATGSKYVKNL